MHTSLDVLNLARKACPRRRSLLLALTIVMVAVGARIELAAVDQPQPRPFAERDLNGTWVLSGLVKFAAPIPIHALILHGGAPHTLVAPGEKVGIWASQVGLMRFDGRGRVSDVENVIKVGEIEPLPPFPLGYLPPQTELGAGSYPVAPSGMVTISIAGRDPNASAPGEVNFETEFQCVLNRNPEEMKCTYSRFKTYFVDPSGYDAPIMGIVTFTRQH